MYRNLSIDIVTPESNDDVKLKASVEAGLAHFFQPETREIKCEKCESGTHASQTLTILSRYVVFVSFNSLDAFLNYTLRLSDQNFFYCI